MNWEVVHDEELVWELRRTSVGRFVSAATWSAAGFLGGGIGGFLFFGIDEVGRATAGVDGVPAFWLSIAALAVLVGFFFFVVRMLRHRSWLLDRGERKLVHRFQRAFNDPQFSPVDFDEIRTVRIEGRPPGAPSRIVVAFDDGSEETLVTTRLGGGGLATLRDAVVEAFAGTDVAVDDRLRDRSQE